MRPTIIAHRCGPDLYPEQSIVSARHALSLGADYVEMDIQYTSDGEPVVCHDPNVKRIFGVDKPVSGMTLAEFMTLRHVSDAAYPSHFLENVLDANLAPILFHLKITGKWLSHFADRIIARHFEEKCVLGVQMAEDVELVKAKSDQIVVLSFMPELAQLDSFLKSRADIIRLWEPWVTRERAEAIHRAGKKLWIMAGPPTPEGVGYTTEESMRYWLELGADGILLNDMRWTNAVLKKLL